MANGAGTKHHTYQPSLDQALHRIVSLLRAPVSEQSSGLEPLLRACPRVPVRASASVFGCDQTP